VGQGRALDIMLSARQVTVDEALAVVRAVNAALELPPDEGLRYEALLEQGLFVDGEAAEGIRAFIAKRAPDFASEARPRPA